MRELPKNWITFVRGKMEETESRQHGKRLCVAFVEAEQQASAGRTSSSPSWFREISMKTGLLCQDRGDKVRGRSARAGGRRREEARN